MLCWWELVVAVAGLVVGAVMFPAAIMEDNRFVAWVSAGLFLMFSVIAVVCFWKLWGVRGVV
jgi:hypothetical protein